MDYTAQLNGDLMGGSLNLGTSSTDALSSLPGGMQNLLSLLLGGWGIGMVIVLVLIVLFLLVVFCLLFKKAGYKWYEALISGHNTFVSIVMSGKPGRYLFLFMVPYLIMSIGALGGATVALITSIIGIAGIAYLYGDVTFSMAKRFKKGIGFGIGMLLLPFIFYPILALGKSKYTPKKK